MSFLLLIFKMLPNSVFLTLRFLTDSFHYFPFICFQYISSIHELLSVFKELFCASWTKRAFTQPIFLGNSLAV